jgi:amidase
MLALADGTDMGGSLRNPAAFCNVVGLRPSIGRVPGEAPMGWLARLTTAGPMARSVADAALLLSVQSGYWPADPLSLEGPATNSTDRLARSLQGLRIAWSPDLGVLPVDLEVAGLIEGAARTFAELGCHVERTCPDLSRAMEVFHVQRAAALSVLGRSLNETLPEWRTEAKASAVWNIDRGLTLHAKDLIASELERTHIYRQTVEFFEHFDALVLPSAQVPPFPLGMEWVSSINGVPMETYIDWMTVCCAISITGLPAISVPGGFTAEGLPVGVQIVGKPHGDAALLQIAYGFEQATGWAERRPPE